MISVLFLPNFQLVGGTADSICPKENGQTVVKDGFYLVIKDGSHCNTVVDLLQKKCGVPWTSGKLYMPLIMSGDGVSTTYAEVTQFGSACNNFSALLQKDSSFPDYIKVLSRYTSELELDVRVRGKL